MSDSFQELDGPYKFKQDESMHWYLVPEKKTDRFSNLLYGEADDFDWADSWNDVINKFNEEFGHMRTSHPSHTKVWVKK